MTREIVGESVLRAIADFPLDGRERFIPSVFKIALGRTWHPAFSPSTLIERRGPVVREWPRFDRVLGTLRSFTERQDFIGEWARAELKAVDIALAGKPLTLKAGSQRTRSPYCAALSSTGFSRAPWLSPATPERKPRA